MPQLPNPKAPHVFPNASRIFLLCCRACWGIVGAAAGDDVSMLDVDLHGRLDPPYHAGSEARPRAKRARISRTLTSLILMGGTAGPALVATHE